MKEFTFNILNTIRNTTFTARYLINITLKLHSITYRLSGRMASILNSGIHPKHQIIQYEKWFEKQIKPDWTVLDIGCNTGQLTWALSQKADKVYGIELIQSLIDTAKIQRSQNNIQYILADATQYDYTRCNKIDCIVMSNVLEHIEDRIDFLKNLIKQIKINNPSRIKFLFRVPMIDRDWITIYKKLRGLEYRLDLTHYTEYTLESFTEEVSLAGLDISEHHVCFGELYASCIEKIC